ncbi:hypothetical protein K503DRAFT_695564, partial [Rhizopogon vinicolor AM-OR11-026]
ITPAYAFTDYISQGQTISHTMIDIKTPPTGGLTPFNVYVALSRSRRQDYFETLTRSCCCEYLRIEDERLVRLDNETEMWWKEKMRYDNSDSQHST